MSIAWAEAMGFGNCGPRWGVTCEAGRGYLTAGLLAFFAILLVHAKIFDGVTGWRGPDTELFFVVFIVPLGGAIAFGSHVFKDGHSALWQLLMAGLSLALIVPVIFMVGSLFRDASGVFKAHFWCLRVKWEDKTSGPMEGILIQPKTPREKNHCSVFLAGRVFAYGVGCSLGLSYIAAVT